MRIVEKATPRKPKSQQPQKQITLPADVLVKVAEIDYLIDRLGHPQKAQKCFCQARLHPLSDPPIRCKICALILCNLNGMLECPSCKFQPLMTQHERDTEIHKYRMLKEQVIEQERERQAIEEEDMKRMAKSVPYPILQAAGVGGSKMNFAAASTPINERVDKAFTAQQEQHTPKVLSLNPTTKKVTVQSSKYAPKSSDSTLNVPEEPQVVIEEPSGYIDAYDDAILSKIVD